MKKILLTLVLIAGFLLQGNAQRLDYENTSNYFIGLNVGYDWHTTDVKNIQNRFPVGAGIIAGRSFNRNYGNLLAFDLRLRYLGGRWYGMDRDTTTFMDSIPSPIYDSQGYVQNFRATQHSLDLELALHFNRLRENTGIDPYIFGGIGIVGSRVKGAAITEPGLDVAAVNYEIPLLKTENGDVYDKARVSLLPSLGVGLGYYFNSQFSLGIEHRTTFYRSDFLDGTKVNQDGDFSKSFKNDLYHYTSIYFRMYLNYRNPNSNNTIIQPDNTGSTLPPANYNPPVVNFTRPSTPTTSTQTNTYQIQASVQNVPSGNNLTFTQNGNTITNFVYNPGNGSFQATVTLMPGANTFILSGVNNYGSDHDQTIIIYDTPQTALPPVVTIVNPASSPTTVNQLTYTVQANIQNITGRNQLNVTFNGNSVSNYNFSPTGGNNFSIDLNLVSGTNTLTIVGTNEAGVDSDHTILIYQRTPTEESGVMPIVTITNPYNRPHTTTSSTQNITATVLNVTNQSQIAVRVNGVNTSNFTYNPSTHQVQLSANLIEGNNTVRVIGTNDYGTANDEVQIQYTKPVIPAPIVNITTPGTRPYTSTIANQTVIATVQNVNDQSQISVLVNGMNTTNFTYSSYTNQVQLNVNLIEGYNTVRITANNAAGSAYDEIQINYNPPRQPGPVVTIINPTLNPYITTIPTQTVTATVLNVNSKNEIFVTVNGVSITNFTYNSNSKQVQFTANLITGINNVVVSANNGYGTAQDERQIQYNQPNMPAPTVTITTPSVRPHTATIGTQLIVATVTNVTDKSQIMVQVNGSQITNFNYTAFNNQIQFTANLVSGNNTVRVTANNGYGSAFDEVQINYRKPSIPGPTVTITTPSTSPYTSSQQAMEVIAKVTNITNKNQVTVQLNGMNISNFLYNTFNQTITFTANLIEGNNNVIVTATNDGGTASDQAQIVYKKPRVPAPTVQITTPATSPYSSSQQTMNIVAKVSNVTNKNQVTVQFNGTNISNFTYNASNQTVNFTANLVQGNNNVIVTATNDGGTASDQAQIVYKAPAQPAPTVTITTPSTKPYTATIATQIVIAKVTNVTDKSQISVQFNGVNVSNFTYSSITNQVQFTVNLNEGNNQAKVTANNGHGIASDEVTITYKKPRVPAPTIQITTPKASPHTATVPTQNVVASYTGLTDASQVTVKLNGLLHTDFLFNPILGQITFAVNLNEGMNTVVITGTNSGGSASDQVQINYNKPVPAKPTVKITTPNTASSTIQVATANVVASVTNVSSKNNIDVKVNGSSISNFTFNSVTNTVQFTATLVEGSNAVKVTATNEGGSASDEVQITYQKVRQPLPVVNITTPGVRPYTTSTATETVIASVLNVDGKNNIDVKVNGVSTSNFTYNTSTKLVQFTANLVDGTNTVTVVATNSGGTANDNIQINKIKPTPPSVTITNPAKDNVTTDEAMMPITAVTQNITGLSQINVKVNGGNSSKVNFNATSQTIQFSASLLEGNNTILIIVTNEHGSATAQRTIIYTKKNPILPPVVTITTPSVSPFITTKSPESVKATVLNIENKAQITVAINGVNTSNFNFNSSTKTVDLMANLALGVNTVTITATNAAGTATDQAQFRYSNTESGSEGGNSQNSFKPKVIFTNPQNSPHSSDNETINISASVTGVNNKEGIQVKVNGSTITNFTFDTSSKKVAFTLNLVSGNNQVNIKGTNNFGSDEANMDIIFKGKEPDCGVSIEIVKEADFCLITPSGTYNLNNLIGNTGFNYNGPATSIYFTSMKNGDAVLNGSTIPVYGKNTYLFTGNLMVDLKYMNGEWILCVKTSVPPIYGTGSKKPISPCATTPPKTPAGTSEGDDKIEPNNSNPGDNGSGGKRVPMNPQGEITPPKAPQGKEEIRNPSTPIEPTRTPRRN